ncbi:hypothetical protein [Paraburkholderia sp.]|uniref:hypothetical protein n=1 Tax=Paraburkholderia sp. TaxID=1926495 RepID=UPI0039E307F2
MITAERKAELIADGYTVEDMGAEWGSDFTGQYRWINKDGSFQDFEPSYAEEDAWECAHQNQIIHNSVNPQ